MRLTLRQNTKNMGLSQYTSMPFDRGIVRIGKRKFGLSKTGLYELTGDNDDGAKIVSEVVTSSALVGGGEKRIRSFHVRGMFSSSDAIAVTYSMADTRTIETEAPQSEFGNQIGNVGTLRFHGSRTEHGEFVMVQLNNVDGAYFHLKNVQAHVVSRRTP
jgi:hypothetical protein